MKRHAAVKIEEITRLNFGTRDAVETAIDLTKRDKSTPWESLGKHGKKISRWKPGESPSHQE